MIVHLDADAFLSWRGEGFYYSAYDAPAVSLKALSAANVNQKVYFHRLGTPQQADRLVFADSLNPLRFNSVVATEDERFEVLYVSDRGSGAKGNALWVRNVQENETVFRPIVRGFDDEMSVVENVGGGLLVVTDRGAPNRRLVQIDPERPVEEHWKVILPERRDPLQSATVISGRIVATYTRDVVAFAMNAPYFLGATDISKLDAYYGLYSRSPEFIEVASRLLFQEIQPIGNLPVSMPGIGYDLNEVTFPCPDQIIPLFLDLPTTPDPTPTPGNNPEPVTLHLGELLPVRTGLIIDRNNHKVPDGTIVRFILTNSSDNSIIQQIDCRQSKE